MSDLVQKAVNFPSPTDTPVYHAEVAIQKNVLLLGKSGGGKTTFFEVLKNPHFTTQTGGTLFASERMTTQYTPLIVRNGDGKAYSFNVIDSPGLFEVRSAAGEKRSNEQILKIVESCLRNHVTSISAVFILFPITSVLNEEDLETLTVISAFLGDDFKKNTILLFTKGDTFQLETLQSKVASFLASPISAPFVDFCQGGIYFTGAVAGEMVAEYGEVYEKKAKHKVTCLRQYLIDAIVACDDVHLPPAFWPPKIEKPPPPAAVVSPAKTKEPTRQKTEPPPKTAEKPKSSTASDKK